MRNFDLFLYHEQAVEHTVELSFILDAMTLMWRHCNEDESYLELFSALQLLCTENNESYRTGDKQYEALLFFERAETINGPNDGLAGRITRISSIYVALLWQSITGVPFTNMD